MKTIRVVAGAGAALLVVQAAAQEGEATLRTIVVTPTPGVAQSAFDTPASVDVVPGEVLRNGQLQINLSESLVRVPGVTALNRQNYAQDVQISVRGFGARATFGVRGLRMYVDGIPATAPDGQSQVSHFDLASADRIEVLRGPFSALYGNSSGGVISLFTADGGPGQEVEVASAFGSDDIHRHNVRVAGEQGPWNWHVSAVRFDTDGFRDHSAAKRESFNTKLNWQISEASRLSLVLNTFSSPDTQDPLGLTRAQFTADPSQATVQATQFNTRKSAEQNQGGLIYDLRLSSTQSVRVLGYYGERAVELFRTSAEHALVPSMSRRGNCWDNAVAESFFATLEKELLQHEVFRTEREARVVLFEFIEIWYNRQRRHSTLGYCTPAEFEERLALEVRAT